LGSRLLQTAASRAGNYLDRIHDRRVFPDPSSVERMYRLGGEMPADGEQPEEVLALLDDFGSPATVATTGGRYFGFVNGATLPAALAANWAEMIERTCRHASTFASRLSAAGCEILNEVVLNQVLVSFGF
jgi:hypothetical protein